MDNMESPSDAGVTQQEVNVFTAAGQKACYFLLVKTDTSDSVALSIADLKLDSPELGIRWSAAVAGSTDTVIAAAVNPVDPPQPALIVTSHRQALEQAIRGITGVSSFTVLQVVGGHYYGPEYDRREIDPSPGRRAVNGWP